MNETKEESPNKRILNEIKKYNLKCVYVDNNSVHIPIKMYDSLQKQAEINNSNPTLILTVKDYPFIVPSVCYLSKPISYIYHTNSIFTNDFKKITGMGCLCCNSFVCPHNWSPTKTMQDIVDEFYEITKLKCRLIERLYCDKIQTQLVISRNKGHENILSIGDIRIAEYL
jgi:hypothetical protein